MKKSTIRQLVISTMVGASCQVAAETNLLPTITIEGQGTRPGQVAVTPESGGALDSALLLKRVPGGNVNRNGPLTNLPQYRGLFGNRIGVRVDGVSIQEVGPNAMDTRSSAVPKTQVKSIKVYRGIAPVSAGMETLGGAIEINSRRSQFAESVTPEFHGMVNAGYSWVDFGRYYGGTLGLSNDRHRVNAGGNIEKGNNYKFRGDKKSVRPSQYDREVFSAGYGFKPADGHEISVDYDFKDTGHTGTPSLPMDIEYIRTNIASIRYTGKLTDNLDILFRGFFNRGRHGMSNHLLRPAPRPGGGAQRFREATTKLQSGGFNLHFLMSDIQGGNLTVGFDGDTTINDAVISDFTNPMFFIDNFVNSTKNRWSGFAEWNGDIAENLNMEIGFRYAHVQMNTDRVDTILARIRPPAAALRDRFNNSDRSKNDNLFDAAAVFRYTASDTLDLEFGAARKTRAPSYQERYLWIPLEATGGLADGRIYVGDPSLDHEKSYQVEMGVDWHDHGAYFAPRAFYRYVIDYIQGLPSTDQATNMVAGVIQPNGPGPLQFSNIDAHLWGVDLETGYAINDNFRIDAILSYVRGKRADGDEDNLYRIAPLNGRVSFTYEYTDWLAALTYVGAMKQEHTANFNGERETSGYSILNLYTQYRPSFHDYAEGITVGVGVDNIIGTQYTDHLNGINRAGNPDLARGRRIPNPGRNVYVTLRYDW
ncbi:MAG: TonB-dependent receptor [Gammaproteobacteria bacterium]|nr:TonB-dependent receptor [Gammaproteobacteria bacterium]